MYFTYTLEPSSLVIASQGGGVGISCVTSQSVSHLSNSVIAHYTYIYEHSLILYSCFSEDSLLFLKNLHEYNTLNKLCNISKPNKRPLIQHLTISKTYNKGGTGCNKWCDFVTTTAIFSMRQI